MSRRSLRTLGTASVAALALATAPAAQAQSLDTLGRPSAPVLGSLENLAAQNFVPASARATITKVVGFFRGEDGKGVPIPENGPRIAQFAWPTVMQNCIDGEKAAVGTATAVPGPASLPLPGVPAHQLAFIFTALGTGPVSAEQRRPLTVSWVNIANGRTGTTPLTFTGVNPEGPATVVGLADTGPGTVLMVLQGSLTTDIEGGTSQCTPLPTVGTATVR